MKVHIFHLINRVGTLTIDNVSVKAQSGFTGIFADGAVSIRFDDGD